MIYDLLIVFSSFFHDYAFGNGRIDHFTDLLNDLLNRKKQILTKYVIKLAKNVNFGANCLVVKHRKGRSKL